MPEVEAGECSSSQAGSPLSCYRMSLCAKDSHVRHLNVISVTFLDMSPLQKESSSINALCDGRFIRAE